MIITSGDSTGLTGHMLSRISRCIRKKPLSRINVIAPDIDFLNNLKTRLIIEEGVDGIQDDIFKTLHAAAIEINPGVNLSSVSILRLILKYALFHLDSRLKFEGRMPGFRRRLFKLFSEFNSTEPLLRKGLLDEIIKSYPDGATENEMMVKIIETYRLFENELGERKLYTRESILFKAIETIGSNHHFGHVFILGFSDFTSSEYLFINSLSEFCDSVTIAAPVSEALNHRKLNDSILRLVENGFEKLLLVSDERKPSVMLRTISTDRNEAEYVARKSAELIERGHNPEDILVIHPRARSFSSTFKSSFNRLGIPFKSSLPVLLKSISPIRDILAILALLNANTDNAMSLLTGRFKIKIAPALKYIQPKTINSFIDGEKIDKPAEVDTESWSMLSTLFAKANNVNSFDDFKMLIEYIAKNCIDIPKQIPHDLTTVAPKAIDTFFSLLDELSGFADNFDFKTNTDRRYSVYLASLVEQVDSSLVRPRDLHQNAVEFTGLDNVLMKSARVVFLTGMSDMNFPTRAQADPLLGEAARNELSKLQFGNAIETAQDVLEREIFLLNTALRMSVKDLFITSPTRDDHGEEIAISPSIRKLYSTGWENAENEKWLLFNRDDLITQTALLLEDESTKDIGAKFQLAIMESYPRGVRALADNESDNNYLSSENTDVVAKKLSHFSATSLANYTQCPFIYFADKILKLPSAQTSLEQIFNPLVKGSVIHEYLSYRIAGDKKQGTIFEILSEKGIGMEDLKFVDDVLLLDSLVFLEKFITEEYERIDKGERKILKTEHPFGMKKGSDFTMNFSGRDWFFSGFIDRIDQFSDGTCAVVDYKITNADVKKLFEDASRFQLPLYALALMETEMTPSVVEIVAVGRNKWSCKSTADLKPDDVQFDELVNQGRENISQAIDSICKGRFPTEPSIWDYCGWDRCGYYHVCRIDR